MSNWSEFYLDRLGSDYLAYVKQRYAPFIAQISKHIKSNNVLEIGAGTSTITASLLENKIKASYIVIDNDDDMLTLSAIRLNNKVKSYKLDCRKKYNILADVVHSHGVLEHMNDSDILKTIKNYNYATQIHYVPGLYDKPSFGDERLLPLNYWINLTKPDFWTTFNNGLDYILGYNPQ